MYTCLQPKNGISRQQLTKGPTDGVKIRDKTFVIGNDVMNEALILSDMFDMDEIRALELVLLGKQRQWGGAISSSLSVWLFHRNRKMCNAKRVEVDLPLSIQSTHLESIDFFVMDFFAG